MPKYKVTGGPEGTSAVEIDGKTHSPGSEFPTSSTKGLKWLLDDGYITLASEVKKSSKSEETEES